ncbi:MAG: MerR family transcriptional regulator [Fibrobacterota bacterium]
MKTTTSIAPVAQNAHYSIGELSKRTGLSVLRIRAWETRHGVPHSIRADSGHRRYPASEALRLELLAQAVRAGGRIGELSALDLDELSKRLPGMSNIVEAKPDRWMDWAKGGQEQFLHDDMVRLWEKHGWRGFVEHCAVPFLKRIGDSWESGQLGIAQEHFASGVLHNFLEERWRLRNSSNTGHPLLLAMLPGDDHSFGLHLCALAAVHADHRVLWLGPHSPAATVLAAVGTWKARGLCLSLSVTTDWNDAKPFLSQLRKELDAEVPFYAGGKGLRGKIKGIQSFESLGDFHDHLLAQS